MVKTADVALNLQRLRLVTADVHYEEAMPTAVMVSLTVRGWTVYRPQA